MGKGPPGPAGKQGPPGPPGAPGETISSITMNNGILTITTDKGKIVTGNAGGPQGPTGVGIKNVSFESNGALKITLTDNREFISSSNFTSNFLKTATMWCADGELCKIPVNKDNNTYPVGSDIILKKENGIEFGHGDTKDAQAGKLLWGKNDTSALEIIGKGTTNTNRTVRIYDRLKIGNWHIYEDGEHLILRRNNDPDEQDKGFFRFSQDGNIYLNRSSGRGWIADHMVKYGDHLGLVNLRGNRALEENNGGAFFAGHADVNGWGRSILKRAT